LVAALTAALALAVAIPLAIGASGERTKALTAVLTGKKEVGSDGKWGRSAR